MNKRIMAALNSAIAHFEEVVNCSDAEVYPINNKIYNGLVNLKAKLKAKQKPLWVVEHLHRHGTSYVVCRADEIPSYEQMVSLFSDFEEDENEEVSCVSIDEPVKEF
jgi:hypothetical protein